MVAKVHAVAKNSATMLDFSYPRPNATAASAAIDLLHSPCQHDGAGLLSFRKLSITSAAADSLLYVRERLSVSFALSKINQSI